MKNPGFCHTNKKNTFYDERVGIHNYMLTICTKSKDHSTALFPLEDPNNWSRACFPDIARQIFAESVGNLISVWL